MKVLLVGNDEPVLDAVHAKLRARGQSVLRRRELGSGALGDFGMAVLVALGNRGLGAELSVRALRAVPGGDVPAILVITDEEDGDTLEALVESGASDFLVWPREAALLGARVAVVEKTATERRRARSSLRQADDRHRSVVEKMPALMHTTDRDGRVQSVSDAWLALLGYSRDEVVGKMSLAFLSEASRKRLLDQNLNEFFATGQLPPTELEFKRKDGDVVRVRLSAATARGLHDEVLGALVAGVQLD